MCGFCHLGFGDYGVGVGAWEWSFGFRVLEFSVSDKGGVWLRA